ncbi:MAG: HAD hydrolase family protein [Cellvibrionaceae bacterium]
MTSIKLAFFDIDGTLIGAEGKYSNRTKRAITLLHNNGIKTAIASGRPPFAAQFLYEELNIRDAGLFFAGAAIYNPSRKQYLKTNYLNVNASSEAKSQSVPSTQLIQLVSAIKENQLYCEVYTRDNFYTEDDCSDIYQAHSTVLRAKAIVSNLNEVIEKQLVVKLLIGANVDDFDLTSIEKDFPHYHFAYAKMASHPNWVFASIIHESSCREKGFYELCQYHQVDSAEVIAFGDAQSDQMFIEIAGTGVAMGDAPTSVKQSANIVTDTSDNDGVASVIEQLFS